MEANRRIPRRVRPVVMGPFDPDSDCRLQMLPSFPGGRQSRTLISTAGAEGLYIRVTPQRCDLPCGTDRLMELQRVNRRI